MDGGEAVCAAEGSIVDGDGALGDGIASALACGEANQRFLVRGKQYPVYACVDRAALFHGELFQLGTARKGGNADGADGGGDAYALQTAVNENGVTDGLQIGRKDDLRKLFVVAEHTVGEVGHARTQLCRQQCGAVGKCVGAYGMDTVGDGNGFQCGTFREGAEFQNLQIGRQGNGFQCAQIIEAVFSNGDETVGQVYLRAVGTPVEGPFPYLCDALADGDGADAFSIAVPRGLGEAVAWEGTAAADGQCARVPIQYPGNAAADGAACSHIADVGGVGHGVGGIEGFGVEFAVAAVGGEAAVGDEEVAVMPLQVAVPCGIGIVILAVQLDDVPAVTFVVCNTADVSAVHAQRQQHPIQQGGVALTDGAAVNDGGVGAVLELVGVVVVVVEVVLNLFRNPVIYAHYLVILMGIVQIQLIQNGCDGCIYLRLLLGGGQPHGGEGEGVVIDAVHDGNGGAVFAATRVVADVVPFVGDTRMGNGKVIHIRSAELCIGFHIGRYDGLALRQRLSDLRNSGLHGDVFGRVDVRGGGIHARKDAHKTQGDDENEDSAAQLHSKHSFKSESVPPV